MASILRVRPWVVVAIRAVGLKRIYRRGLKAGPLFTPAPISHQFNLTWRWRRRALLGKPRTTVRCAEDRSTAEGRSLQT